MSDQQPPRLCPCGKPAQRLALLLREAALDAYLGTTHEAWREVGEALRRSWSTYPGDGWLHLAEELLRRGVRPPEV